MISVICCYNNEEQFKTFSDNLKKQNVLYELIPIDNRKHIFKSAAAALNYGAERASGDILVFSHQDILFLSKESLELLTEPIINNLQQEVISGAFGVFLEDGLTKGTKDHSVAKSVDECLFAMSRRTWEKNPFDEQICDGWHLYAVELCYRIRQQGGKVIGVNCCVEHLSEGNIDSVYMMVFRKLIKKYSDFEYIITTCKTMPTSLIYFWLYYPLWRFKKALFGNYHLMAKCREIINPQR